VLDELFDQVKVKEIRDLGRTLIVVSKTSSPKSILGQLALIEEENPTKVAFMVVDFNNAVSCLIVKANSLGVKIFHTGEQEEAFEWLYECPLQ